MENDAGRGQASAAGIHSLPASVGAPRASPPVRSNGGAARRLFAEGRVRHALLSGSTRLATNRSLIRAGKPRRLGRFRARLDARRHDRRPRPYRHWRAEAAVPQLADASSGAQHRLSAPIADFRASRFKHLLTQRRRLDHPSFPQNKLGTASAAGVVPGNPRTSASSHLRKSSSLRSPCRPFRPCRRRPALPARPSLDAR